MKAYRGEGYGKDKAVCCDVGTGSKDRVWISFRCDAEREKFTVHMSLEEAIEVATEILATAKRAPIYNETTCRYGD